MYLYDLRSSLGLAFIFAVCVTAAVHAQSSTVKDDLSSSFKRSEVVQIRSRSAEGLNGETKQLSFRMNGRSIDLDLTANDLRAPNYFSEDSGPAGLRQLEKMPVTTFKGTVRGVGDSEVRVLISGQKIEGFFVLDGEHYFVEPVSKYSASASNGDSVIYRAEDSLNDSTFACEADVPTRIGMGDKLVMSQGPNALEAMRGFDIATEADREYVNVFGTPEAANQEILSILNMVEGTYSSQLNLRIRVTYQHTWTTADPYAGADSGVILSNFRNHWNLNYPIFNYPRHTAHLFTAKSNSLSQGVAYLGVICQNPSAAYGLSGYVSWAPGKYLVPAHELGHNLGGQHAEAAQSCANTLMNAQLSGSTPMSFCAYSQSQINGYIATSGGCMMQISSKRFDFDGDSRADTAVFRPTDGKWYVRKSNGGYAILQFGLNGDIPVSGDYDGDGRADAAVFRNGTWWRLKSATNTIDSVNFGLAGDIPVPANFDSDGVTDVAVFRPSTGQWFWLRSGNSSFNTFSFGLSGDVPLPADYDGDGVADLNVFRPSNGTWYRIGSFGAVFNQTQFGLNGDKPIMGDFDGDGRADIAVFRPSTSEWYLIRSSDSGFRYFSFGVSGDIPAAGDFDGDSKTDISVFRPSNGTWYRLNSSDWQFISEQYGLSGDTPVPSYYVQ